MSDNLHAVMLMSCQLSIVPADSGWPVECKESFTEWYHSLTHMQFPKSVLDLWRHWVGCVVYGPFTVFCIFHASEGGIRTNVKERLIFLEEGSAKHAWFVRW